MNSIWLSRFTDDLVSEAVDQLDYKLDFKNQTAQEKLDYAEIKRKYNVYLDKTDVTSEISLKASIPTDSNSPRYELKLAGLNKVQEELTYEVEKISVDYLEGASSNTEGEISVIEGFIREDTWLDYIL